MRHSSKGDYPHPKKTSTVQSVVRMTDGVCVDDELSIYKQTSDRFFAEHRQEILSFAKENGNATVGSRHRKG